MSNLRVFWIIWCAGWALGWLLVGFFTFFLGWLMVPLSLVAILIPVGIEPAGLKCLRCGKPEAKHFQGRCPELRQIGR